jgi:hypothetical protein
MTSTTCTAATPLASLWCIVFWMVAGRTIRSSLTVMKPGGEENKPWEKKVTKFMKKLWPKVKDADRRNMVGRYSALLLQIKITGHGMRKSTLPGEISASQRWLS